MDDQDRCNSEQQATWTDSTPGDICEWQQTNRHDCNYKHTCKPSNRVLTITKSLSSGNNQQMDATGSADLQSSDGSESDCSINRVV